MIIGDDQVIRCKSPCIDANHRDDSVSLSGVVLGAVFFALVWFGNATTLLVVALVVCVLAFHEYARLMRALAPTSPRRQRSSPRSQRS